MPLLSTAHHQEKTRFVSRRKKLRGKDPLSVIKKVFQIFIEIPDGVSDEDFCPKETFADIEWRRTLVNRKDETACPEGTVGNSTFFLAKISNIILEAPY